MMCDIICFQIVSHKKLQQETFQSPCILLSLPLCTEILVRVILSLLHHHPLSPNPMSMPSSSHFLSCSPHSLAPFAHSQTVLYVSAKGSLICKTNEKENIIWIWRWNPCSLQMTSTSTVCNESEKEKSASEDGIGIQYQMFKSW
jgi:hypothetical protein